MEEEEEEKVPADIHFINLSWPKFSCLLSDDITKVLDKNKVDDFSRLKINLRNIDNSAKWLTSYVQGKHTNKELCEALDWEITRHIGYLVNFLFLKDNSFQSARQFDIEYYIGEKHMKQYLSELFMSYNSDGNGKSIRMEMVDKYLDLYFCDRREHRLVILNKRQR